MRITRPLSFVLKQATKTLLRKLTVATFGFTLLSVGVIAGQNILVNPGTASAVTPPDSCFGFDTATGTITEYYYNENNESENVGASIFTAAITPCPLAVDIPSTIGGVAVTGIGVNVFSNRDLTSVTIPSSVTNIGNYAFFSNQITNITILGTNATFGADVFNGNPIENLTYNGVTYTSSTTPAEQCYTYSAGRITNYRYADMTLIKNNGIGCLDHEITVPTTLGGTAITRIGANAFMQKSLTSVIIPNTITQLGDLSFYGNSLTSVTLPNTITTLPLWVFNVNRLTSITIPSSVTTIGGSAFAGNQLTSVTIPSSVTNIGGGAFNGNQLTSVTIPNSVTTIGANAFENNELSAVSIPSSVTSLGDSAFRNNNISALPTYFNTATTIPGYIFELNQFTSLSIPNSVTTIGDNAFGENQLTDVKLGNAVTSVGERAFYYNEITSISFPNTIVSIGDYAFWYNQLSSVVLPASITSIGDGVFNRNNLTTVTIPNSVTTIGLGAFAANQLKTLNLGSSVTTIGGNAFASNALQTVTIPTSVNVINSTAFTSQNTAGGGIEDEFDSYEPSRIAAALNGVWYARLFTSDPANPQNLKDGVKTEFYDETIGYCEADDPCPYDFNEDGDEVDIYTDNYGGHIINPASVTLTYFDNNGNEVQPSQTFTGKLDNGTMLTNYFASQGPSVPPAEENSVIPFSSLALDPQQQALQAYYRIGDTFTYTAPVINGVTPNPATISFVLGSSTQVNNRSFVYTAAALNNNGQLANTGLSIYTVFVAAGLVILASAIGTFRYLKIS